MIPVKIITKEEAGRRGLLNNGGSGGQNFGVRATGRIGEKNAHTVKLQSLETGELFTIMENGKAKSKNEVEEIVEKLSKEKPTRHGPSDPGPVI